MSFQKPGHYSKADRAKIPQEDFAGPDRTFPIVTPEDVHDAADLHGHAADPEAVKKKVIEIARRKGKEFVDKLPEEWTAGDSAGTSDHSDFGGQFIEIFSAGTHTDNQGRQHNLGTDFLEDVVRNFNPSVHEPPAVVGHPKTNSPAYGWAKELRVKDGRLEARLGEVAPEFEEMVRKGRLKKRSASFYLDEEDAPGGQAPQLRHIGFLGGKAPAVAGLRDIQFSDGGHVITFSQEEEMDEKQVEGIVKRVFSRLFGGGDDGHGSRALGPASFSEADVTEMITKATSEVRTALSQEIKGLKDENKKLADQVGSIGKDSKRARIVAFSERLGAAKFPPAFRRPTAEGGVGVVEFMEKLAESDAKITIVEFSEKDGKKVETRTETGLLEFFEHFLEEDLPRYIEFGEKFGAIKDTGDGSGEIDENRLNAMRAAAGIKPAQKEAGA